MLIPQHAYLRHVPSLNLLKSRGRTRLRAPVLADERASSLIIPGAISGDRISLTPLLVCFHEHRRWLHVEAKFSHYAYNNSVKSYLKLNVISYFQNCVLQVSLNFQNAPCINLHNLDRNFIILIRESYILDLLSSKRVIFYLHIISVFIFSFQSSYLMCVQ